ncbi:MAG: transglycosylase domain-containing protein [Bacillota bacterium]|jgi:penicillin-binding protein 1A
MSDIDYEDFYKEKPVPQPVKHTARKRKSGSGGGKRKKRKGRKLKIWAKILIAFFILFLIGCICVFGYAFSVVHGMDEWSVDSLDYSSTTFIIDNEGTSFEEIHGGENRIPLDIEDMPQQLVDCFISTEDVRFYKHSGVDVKRIFGAALADIKSGSFSQGASTITMQLARNAILEDQSKRIDRKIKEAYIALQIEKQYNKDEILELYMNTIYFGHGAYGVEAAARTYFGKRAGELSLGECAAIVGLVRNPSLYSPIDNLDNSYKVRDTVLNNLVKYDESYTADAEAAKSEDIVVAEYEDDGNDYTYPWFTDYVIGEAEDILESLGLDESTLYTGGYKVYTTVDKTVQSLMEEGYANTANFPTGTSSTNQVESAMAVLNNETGEIRGLVGGRSHTTKRGYNRATDMQRQPGSTFKPIAVFAPAIEMGYSPASVVNDVNTSFNGDYTPTNYDGKYRGVVSMRDCAIHSMNIPAVKFMQKIGVDYSMHMIEKMGISMENDQNSGLSLALGGMTYGVSPLQMAAAYATFANGGVYNEPYAIRKIENSKGEIIYQHEAVTETVMKETTAYLVTNMLMSVTERGTGTNAQISGMEVASKTGTVQLPKTEAYAGIENGNKDAWFAAYTPDLTGVVWMGYDKDLDENGKPQYLQQIYGGKYPAMIWKKVVGGTSQNASSSTFNIPSGITYVPIDIKSGLLPSELTPSEFIKTEVFDSINVPKEKSDIWKKVRICTVSGKTAGPSCTNTAEKVRYYAPSEYSDNKVNGQPDDTTWLYNSTTCTVCGGN